MNPCTSLPSSLDDTDELPCAGGLLAGTLALMTGWADPEPGATLAAAQQRALMARKIASNLFFLREHPALPPGLRLVAAKLQARWSELASRDGRIDASAPSSCAAVH